MPLRVRVPPLLGSVPPPPTQTVTQIARFNNVNQFYSGTVSQVSQAKSVTQTSRFDNNQVFYGGVVTVENVTLGSGRYLFIRRRRC